MRFTPKSEEECRRPMRVLPKGDYDFEVMFAEERVSSNGNEMIELKLAFYDGNDAERPAATVYDYLLESIDYKLRHAAYVCGVGNKYEVGDLKANDFFGATGRAKLKVEKYTDKNGNERDKNTVADYLVNEKSEKHGPSDVDCPPIGDEDLPF